MPATIIIRIEDDQHAQEILAAEATTKKTQTMYHETITELLAAWDRGETIWTIEMGGYNLEHEHAIQVSAIEFARAGQTYKPTGNLNVDAKAWDMICTETLHRINKIVGGLSGAGYCAASWLAWQWCHKGGPKKLIERVEKEGLDRIIQISNPRPVEEACKIIRKLTRLGHLPNCASLNHTSQPCDCGYDEAVELFNKLQLSSFQ